jgi:predicted enzyme related to lactoylglutathione lyase
MTSPVTYVELNTPDLQAASRFFAAVFDWDPQPFAAPDYLVAPAGVGRGCYFTDPTGVLVGLHENNPDVE